MSCLVGKWDEMRGRLEALDSFAAVSRGLRGSTAPALALQELQVLAANDVSARVGELADQARVMALDMLGDAEHAAVIAGRRLRTLPDFASGTSPAGVEGPRL